MSDDTMNDDSGMGAMDESNTGGTPMMGVDDEAPTTEGGDETATEDEGAGAHMEA